MFVKYLSPSNFISIWTRTVVSLCGQFCDFFQRSPFYRGVVLPRGLLYRWVSLDLGEGAPRFRGGGAHPRDGPALYVLRCVSYRLLPTNNGCSQSSCSASHDIRQYVVMWCHVYEYECVWACVYVCVWIGLCDSIVQLHVVCYKCKWSPFDPYFLNSTACGREGIWCIKRWLLLLYLLIPFDPPHAQILFSVGNGFVEDCWRDLAALWWRG